EQRAGEIVRRRSEGARVDRAWCATVRFDTKEMLEVGLLPPEYARCAGPDVAGHTDVAPVAVDLDLVALQGAGDAAADEDVKAGPARGDLCERLAALDNRLGSGVEMPLTINHPVKVDTRDAGRPGEHHANTVDRDRAVGLHRIVERRPRRRVRA